MSGVNISYEIASTGGPITYYEENSLCSKGTPNLANVIAGEIVNEILENALDIATRASDTGIHWKEIKESRSQHRATNMDQSHVNESDPQNAKQKINDSHRETLCSNIVGDIVEHIGIPSAPDISNIIDGLNSINVIQETEQDKSGAESIDIEMKKLLAEMLAPPYENLPANGGIGDQPNEITENITNQPAPQPEIPSRTVEKKSRVTDLVKNSPRIISEYLMMDDVAKQNQEEWEESTEQILQVIELDHVKVGEEPFRAQKSVFPEEVALPIDDDEDELLQMPSDDLMDVIIDLSSNAFKEEERQLSSTNENSTGAKGDDRKNDNLVFTAKPYRAASTDGEVIGGIATNQKEFVGTPSNADVEQQKVKKKKCNFGTRLWEFLKKGHKTNGQGSSTST